MKEQQEKRPTEADVPTAEGMKEGRLGTDRSVKEELIEEMAPNYVFDDEDHPDKERER